MNKYIIGFIVYAVIAASLVVGQVNPNICNGTNLLVNPGFDQSGPCNSAQAFCNIPSDLPSIPGWSANDVDLVEFPFAVFSGLFAIDLNGVSSGSISQKVDISSLVNQCNISFWVSTNKDIPCGTGSVLSYFVSQDSNILSSGIDLATPPSPQFQFYSFSFSVNSSDPLNVTFLGNGEDNGFGPIIDSVSLTCSCSSSTCSSGCTVSRNYIALQGPFTLSEAEAACSSQCGFEGLADVSIFTVEELSGLQSRCGYPINQYFWVDSWNGDIYTPPGIIAQSNGATVQGPFSNESVTYPAICNTPLNSLPLTATVTNPSFKYFLGAFNRAQAIQICGGVDGLADIDSTTISLALGAFSSGSDTPVWIGRWDNGVLNCQVLTSGGTINNLVGPACDNNKFSVLCKV